MRLWPITLILLLMPLWYAGMFGRWYWTPDEPREADIAWNMAQQQGAVPHMAGVPFAEKPPLTYWASGASISALGKNPAAARLPNLAWAVLSVLAIAFLAYAWAGVPAALVAGVASATFALNFQVAVWLASDAPLVTGVCVALLGLYRGMLAPPGRQKLAWYTLMHAGLLLGFLAKNIIAWVVPGLAMLAFVAWEWRWREFLRWELYAGLALQAAVLVPWIMAVADHPDGRRLLKVFFWDNLVGRFLPVASEGNYADGHANSPFKYLRELPAYLLPWLFLVAAACRRAWRGVREIGGDGPAWRFSACVVIPTFVLLSAANTGRGIYLAPLLPGFALALGLWAARHLAAPDRFERVCLWATGGLVAIATLAIGPGVLVVAGVTGQTLDGATIATVVVGGLAAGVLGGKLLLQHRRGAHTTALFTALIALDIAVLVAWRGLFPLVDRWQNLTPTVERVVELAEHRPLLLWQPDETTVSNLDYLADLRPPAVQDGTQLAAQATEPGTFVLARIDRGQATANLTALGWHLDERLEIRHGRTYGIFARPEP